MISFFLYQTSSLVSYYLPSTTKHLPTFKIWERKSHNREVNAFSYNRSFFLKLLSRGWYAVKCVNSGVTAWGHSISISISCKSFFGANKYNVIATKYTFNRLCLLKNQNPILFIGNIHIFKMQIRRKPSTLMCCISVLPGL